MVDGWCGGLDWIGLGGAMGGRGEPVFFDDVEVFGGNVEFAGELMEPGGGIFYCFAAGEGGLDDVVDAFGGIAGDIV